MNSFALTLLVGLAIGSSLIYELDAANGCATVLTIFSARRYSYDKIETFLEQVNQDPEVQIKELTDWYSKEYKSNYPNGKREQRLKETLGYIVDLAKVKSPDSCNPSNRILFEYLISDAKLDFFNKKKDTRVEKLIKHFIAIYDNDCTIMYTKQFESAIKDLSEEDLAEARKFGQLIASYRPDIGIAARFMIQDLLYKVLYRVETEAMDQYENLLDQLSKSCTAYVRSIDDAFFQKVIDFSRLIRKDWNGKMTLPNGWIDWEICDSFLKGDIRKRRPKEDEDSPAVDGNAGVAGALYASGVL